MPSITTKTLTFSSIIGSGGTGTIHEAIATNLCSIVFVKCVPSIAGGTTTLEIFQKDTLGAADLAYKATTFSGTLFDPIEDQSGTAVERNEGPVATYVDDDTSNEMHVKITNNDTNTKNFTVTIKYIDLGSGVVSTGTPANDQIAVWTGADTLEGNNNAKINSSGQLALSTTGSSAGILIGADALWYRSAINVMRTPDSLTVDGAAILSGTLAVTGAVTFSTVLAVAQGGTGLTTITDGGVLLGSGTGAITPLGQAANGQLVVGSTGADSVLATLTGTANEITVTNGAGSITLAIPDAVTLVTPTITGTLSIGSDLGGRLNIDGNADEPQLHVQGHSTQTTSLVIFENSAGIDLFTLANVGQLALPISGSSAGLLLGGDVLLYRVSANILRTPDALTVDGATILSSTLAVTGAVTFSTVLAVAQGGTGATSLTDGGILLGSGTGAITTLGAATNGQIPIGDGTTDPVLANIGGTTKEITVTNGAGTIILSLPSIIEVTTSLAVGGIAATSAGLELQSTTKSILVSRMTTTQRNALTAADGMVLYNTTDNQMQGRVNAAWVDLGGGGGGGGTVTSSGTPTNGQIPVWTTATDLEGVDDLTIPGDLVVTGTGPHAFGGAVLDYVQTLFTGSFTSGGSADRAQAIRIISTLTGAPGDTNFLAAVDIAPAIITQTATENIGKIASLRVDEPQITNNLTGNITDAYTVLITTAPTEGVNNLALGVVTGQTRFGAVGTNDGHVHILSPSTSTRSLIVEMPASSTVSAQEWQLAGVTKISVDVFAGGSSININSADLGNDIQGPYLLIGRNSNATNPNAGVLAFADVGQDIQWLWMDNSANPGNLRVNTDPPAAGISDTAGTVIGTQTSWHHMKVYVPTTLTTSEALQRVAKLDVYNFRYKDHASNPWYTGLVGFNRDDWFLTNTNRDQIPSLDTRSIIGHYALSIQELLSRIETLEAAA